MGNKPSAEVNTAQAVHTPTPWIAEATNARGEIEIEADSTGRGYVHGGQDTVIARIPMRPLDREDAEFIVRAVNSHAELLEALIALRTWCLANKIQPTRDDAWGHSAFSRAASAIEKAEVQS